MTSTYTYLLLNEKWSKRSSWKINYTYC